MAVRVVVDVEMCGVQVRTKSYPYKNEIIQIGAVMMDDSFKMLDKFSTYVRPRHGKIDHYIGMLTGISERALKEAPDIEDALRRFVQWVGDDDVVFYSWSTTDYYQIRREIQYKCQEDDLWNVLLEESNWIDYQEKLGKRIDSPRRIKLADALELVELDTEGHMHDGLDDAYNTARMIAKLEVNKDYKTFIEKFRANEESQKPLTASLGDLLKGLVLETA